MNIQDYLDRLQTELKGLSTEEKSVLIEEISFHLYEGQSDPILGNDEEKRLERLTVEMDSPEELGHRLKNIHQPKQWLEYLLIVIPEFFLFPLLSGAIAILFSSNGSTPTAQDLSVYLGIRAFIFLQICLVLITFLLYKRQGLPGSLLYWLSSSWLVIFSLCLREGRWAYSSDLNRSVGGIIETIFWTITLIGLLIGLSKILWKMKDPLWLTFVSIPFLTALGNLATSQILISGGFPDGYPIQIWRVGWFGLHQLVRPIWPALLLFPKQRIFHWFALFTYAVPFALMNLIASSHYPHLILLWATPILLVSGNWAFDLLGSKRLSRMIK